MKAKVIISLGMVVGLAVCSVVAYASTEDTTEVSTKMEQNKEEMIVIQENLAVIAKEKALFQDILLTNKSAKPRNQFVDYGKRQKPEDAYLLAKLAMAEAEGEDIEGKALVIRVVLNRVQADKFPDTVEAVIYQKKQFSPIANGRFDRVEPNEDCWQALSMIEFDHWDESMGATYFESKSKSTWHEKNLKFLFKHGSHYFYMEQGAEHE